jgi:NAD(P)-dependent dehydrogenase (short-subunit alcohol dehydrogenase family)
MMVDMHRQTVIVTGANGGLGLSVVKYLWLAGYNVIATYRNDRSKLDFLASDIAAALPIIFNDRVSEGELMPTDEKIRANSYFVDVIDDESVKVFAENVLETHGTPYGIINLAGGSSNAMSWKMSSKEFKTIVEQNLLSTWLVTCAFVPAMRSANRGRIINASSVVGETGVIGAAHYAAAKAGVVGLTKSLALELAPKNITVNALGLGYFDSGLITSVPQPALDNIIEKTPLKRLGTAHDLCSTILFLLSEGAFITGQTININGGLI